MKVLLVFTIVVCVFAGFAAAGPRRRGTRRQQFTDWRTCMVQHLPTEKRAVYDGCYANSRGTEMHKFRDGLKCVLSDYHLVSGTNVDLSAMTALASSVPGKLGQAFTDCPKDDHNRKADKNIKCIIDHLET
ncbi:unnamed protein product, partial [Ixodes hexagonus]